MQTERISVTGMTCGGCVESVTRSLQAVVGVTDVNVSLVDASAMVQFDENLTSAKNLEKAIQQAGFDVGNAKASTTHGKGCCCN